MATMEDWDLNNAWTKEEDAVLAAYVAREGERSWHRVGEKMGLNRNGFSCWERWTTYLKPKLNTPTPGPIHGVKGTEKEVKSHNLHSLLHSTAATAPTPTPSQNVGVLPMHNILSGITNKRSMFSSGVPIHGKNEMKSQNLHSVLHSTPTPTPASSQMQNVGVLPMHNILTGIANKRSMFSSGVPILDNNEAKFHNLHSVLHSTPTTSTTSTISAPSQNVGVLPMNNILTGITNNWSMFSSGVPIHGKEEVKSQNLHSVLHSTPTPTPIPAPSQNVGILPVDNILTGITNKRSMFSSGDPIQQNKRFRAAEATTNNPPKMFLKPCTELAVNNFSAAIETQRSAAVLSGNVLNSNSKELPSVQINAALPERINIPTAIGAQLSASIQSGNVLKSPSKELPSSTTVPKRIRLQRVCYAKDIKLIPTSSLTTSNANQSTLCKEHERYIAPVPSDAEHAISDGCTMESDCSIISQGTDYPMEELFEHVEKRVMSDSMDQLLGKSVEKEMSESQLAPSSLVKEQVEGRVDHLFRELEMLVQNTDEGMTEGNHSITPQGTDHLMEEQPGQTEKQERSQNLGGECGKLIQYSGADEIYDESRYFSNEEDAEIFCLLKGFVQSSPSPYLYSP